MTLDLTSGFTGQSTSRVGAALPGPYVQATGAPRIDVALLADVDFESGVAEDSNYSIVTSSGGTNFVCHLPPASDPPQELDFWQGGASGVQTDPE